MSSLGRLWDDKKKGTKAFSVDDMLRLDDSDETLSESEEFTSNISESAFNALNSKVGGDLKRESISSKTVEKEIEEAIDEEIISEELKVVEEIPQKPIKRKVSVKKEIKEVVERRKEDSVVKSNNISSNPIFDKLSIDLLNKLKGDDIEFLGFNKEQKEMLFDYIIDKF